MEVPGSQGAHSAGHLGIDMGNHGSEFYLQSGLVCT
jgi:hypothetical protein